MSNLTGSTLGSKLGDFADGQMMDGSLEVTCWVVRSEKKGGVL